MAAQDEGRVSLDRLPLADLKTWLEDNLSLNAPSTTIQQIGGGGTTVIDATGTDTTTGWFRYLNIYGIMPRPHMVGSFTTMAMQLGEQRFLRFMAPISFEFNAVMLALQADLPPASTIEWALYNAAGDTDLAYGLWTAPSYTGVDIDPSNPPATQPNAPRWIYMTKIGGGDENTELVRGQIYTISIKFVTRTAGVADLSIGSIACGNATVGARMFDESNDKNHLLAADLRTLSYSTFGYFQDGAVPIRDSLVSFGGAVSVNDQYPLMLLMPSGFTNPDELVWTTPDGP